MTETKFYLRNLDIALISCYYIFFIIVGIITLTMLIFRFNQSVPIYMLSFMSSIILSFISASTYYLRKIYKICFADLVLECSDGVDETRRIGAVIYFFSRPIMASLMSAVGCILLFANFKTSAPPETSPTDGILYSSLIVGFSTGYFTGKVFDRLNSSNNINSIIE